MLVNLFSLCRCGAGGSLTVPLSLDVRVAAVRPSSAAVLAVGRSTAAALAWRTVPPSIALVIGQPPPPVTNQKSLGKRMQWVWLVGACCALAAGEAGEEGEQELLTRYLLSRLLGGPAPAARPAPLKHLLEQAKQNIDVIDFRQPGGGGAAGQGLERRSGPAPRQRPAPSETVPVFLPFPGTEPNQRPGPSQGQPAQRSPAPQPVKTATRHTVGYTLGHCKNV